MNKQAIQGQQSTSYPENGWIWLCYTLRHLPGLSLGIVSAPSLNYEVTMEKCYRRRITVSYPYGKRGSWPTTTGLNGIPLNAWEIV